MANKTCSRNRIHGTIELFDRYWVKGYSSHEIPNGQTLFHQRGIPMRSQEDAQRYRRGDVELSELWDDYLTEFQINLAQELKMMQISQEVEEE